jgi:hypothetical protein
VKVVLSSRQIPANITAFGSISSHATIVRFSDAVDHAAVSSADGPPTFSAPAAVAGTPSRRLVFTRS